MIEGEPGAMVRGRIQMPGRYAGFEDQSSERLRYAASIVYDGQGPVAAPAEGCGDVDVAGAGIKGVTEEFVEGVLHGVYAGGAPAGAFRTHEAYEAPAEVPVRSFHGIAESSLRECGRRLLVGDLADAALANDGHFDLPWVLQIVLYLF